MCPCGRPVDNLPPDYIGSVSAGDVDICPQTRRRGFHLRRAVLGTIGFSVFLQMPYSALIYSNFWVLRGYFRQVRFQKPRIEGLRQHAALVCVYSTYRLLVPAKGPARRVDIRSRYKKNIPDWVCSMRSQSRDGWSVVMRLGPRTRLRGCSLLVQW